MAQDKDGDLIPAINRLVEDIAKREVETAEMKRTVNRLCSYAKLPIKYSNIEEASAVSGLSIKPGQFFRKPLATAVQMYLKMRGDPNGGGMGPATLDDVFDALREGGFIFVAQNDGFAKRALAIALAKASHTFTKLPTGEFGLKTWYRRENE